MYACTAFAQDGITCTVWAEIHFLPPLSIADGAAIGASAMGVLALVWAYRQLRRLL